MAGHLERGRSARVRSFVGLGVIVAVLAAVVARGAQSATEYYVTVSQVAAHPQSYLGHPLRVEGALLPRTVRFSPRAHLLTFRIGQGGKTLLVTYSGAAPDDFTQGANAIVEGTEVRPGVVVARHVLVQCPDHYTPVPGTQVLSSAP
jgi:cytochrome c-type biogenesis protein CcmE